MSVSERVMSVFGVRVSALAGPSKDLRAVVVDAGFPGELVCDGCGYRVARARPPERCPMCQGSGWRAGRVRRTTGLGA